MKIGYSPEALDDLKFIKEDIENQYGKDADMSLLPTEKKSLQK